MAGHPGARRARNLVLLVVLTVALPSLLLTGFGALAIHNESAAAYKRVEQLYKPVISDVAARFNALMDQWVAEANPALDRLRLFAAGGALPPEFATARPYAVNYFVLDDDEVLLPKQPDYGEPPTSALPTAFLEALAPSPEKSPGDCRAWSALAEGSPGRCLAAYARALCDGERGAAFEWRTSMGVGCEELAGDELIQRGWVLRQLSLHRQVAPAPFVDEAERLLARLSSPDLESSAWLQELLARDTAARLKGLSDPRADRIRRTLMQVAERPALLSTLTRKSHLVEAPASVSAQQVGNWYRVLVTRASGDALAGFELAPSAIQEQLDVALKQGTLEWPVRAHLTPVLDPPWWGVPEGAMDRVAAWVLLKNSDLAWELALVFDCQSTLAELTRTRSSLYLWALILVVASLVGGIVYTLRSVAREARESRLKTDFVSSVSHDLRTPLTSIRMFVETLQLGRVQSREEERECLQVIAQETERLSRLTERILDFSRMEAGRKAYCFKPEPVGDLVRQALAACQPLITQGGFRVELALDPAAESVEVDRDAIIEALINLVTNALKYSPDERYLKVATRAGPGVVELSVSDQGIGIARADQRRIFEKFYRVDCRRTTEVGGCGIGLSLVEHIVQAHRGTVSVESEPGKGSTFTVRLPASQGNAPSPAEGSGDGEDPDRRGRAVDRRGPAAKSQV